MVAYGPARIREKSATSTPSSGPGAAPPPRSLPASRTLRPPPPSPPPDPCEQVLARYSPCGCVVERVSDPRTAPDYPDRELRPLTLRSAAGESDRDRFGMTVRRTNVRDGAKKAMADRRPVLFRNGTVLTMDDAHTVVSGGDVLVVDDRIAEVGAGLSAPDGALEIDATGGIVMPGMVDTHRHMWQTAMRAYGADWTLDPVLRLVLPRARPAVPPRGRPRRQPAVRVGRPRGRGVTPTVDWSHGLQSVDHADAAVDALPGGARPVRARVRQHPGRALGVDGRPGGEGVLRPPPLRRRHARPSRSPSTCSARSRSPRGRRSRSPASWACRTPPMPGLGERPTTTASG